MTINEKLLNDPSFQKLHEPRSIYSAVAQLKPGYRRTDGGPFVVHRFVGRVGEAVTVAQFSFNRNARSLYSSSDVNIDVYVPGQKFFRRTACNDALFDDEQLQAKFNEVSRVADATIFGEDRYLTGDVDGYNEISGFDGRVVTVNGIKFGRVLEKVNNLPLFAQRLTAIGSGRDCTGRVVLESAREARKVIYPELRDVQTITDLLKYLPKKPTTRNEHMLSYNNLNVIIYNGEPLVLSNALCETVVVSDLTATQSIRSFTSSQLSKFRKL